MAESTGTKRVGEVTVPISADCWKATPGFDDHNHHAIPVAEFTSSFGTQAFSENSTFTKALETLLHSWFNSILSGVTPTSLTLMNLIAKVHLSVV